MKTQSARSARLIPGLVLLLPLGVCAPALADDAIATTSSVSSGAGQGAPTAEEVAAALDAAGSRVETGLPTTETPGGFVANTSRDGVTIASDAGGQLAMRGDNGKIQIGVPGGSESAAVATPDGVLFEGALTDTSILAKATDGGAQVLAVLGSADAPTSLSFPVNAGPRSSLTLNPDGSVSVLELVSAPDGTSHPVIQGEFASPWAVDANGAAVPTTYEVRDRVLVQRIHPTESTVFPVTADPNFVTGWTGLFVHWTRSETKWLAGLGLAATASAVGVMCAGPHVVLCAAAVGGIWYILNSVSNYTVDYMYDRGYRFTTRLTPFQVSYWEKR